ncbi:MAG TPA: VOC family protein [Bryobacteraceae bacterium]|nr:VOC family protein [Bryobacteraceae bacterium]
MIQGLEHIALASPDPVKLAQWYVDHLSFTIYSQSPTSKTTFVRAPNGGMLEIIASKGEPQPQQLRDPGIRHLAIAVTEFEAEYERLKANGVTFVTSPETAKGNTVVFFKDLDGNFVHLIQREKPIA